MQLQIIKYLGTCSFSCQDTSTRKQTAEKNSQL